MPLRTARRREVKRLRPMPPETKLKIGKRRSGTTYCEAKSVTRPSAKTPSVCVIVTVKPRKAACRAVPREPTK